MRKISRSFCSWDSILNLKERHLEVTFDFVDFGDIHSVIVEPTLRSHPDGLAGQLGGWTHRTGHHEGGSWRGALWCGPRLLRPLELKDVTRMVVCLVVWMKNSKLFFFASNRLF